MNSKSNQYDFTQPSSSGKPGYEVFQSEKNGLFYFHFNDKKGNALLFSQAYQSAESRDKGMASAKKNASDHSRYEIKTEKQQFFFLLKAGNNQEIARSRLFDSKLALDKAMDALAAFQPAESQTPAAAVAVASPVAPAPTKVAVPTATAANEELNRLKIQTEAASQEKERLEAEVKKLTTQIEHLKKAQASKPKPPAAPTASLRANKDAFRLEFFHEKDEPARGVIEHLYTEKKLTFKGLDWAGILNFMAGYVWRDKQEHSSLIVQESTAQPGNQAESETSDITMQASTAQMISQVELEAIKKTMQEAKAGKLKLTGMPVQASLSAQPEEAAKPEIAQAPLIQPVAADPAPAAPTPAQSKVVAPAPVVVSEESKIDEAAVAPVEPVELKISTFRTANDAAPNGLFKTGASIFLDLPAGQPVSDAFLEATILPVDERQPKRTVNVSTTGRRVVIAGLQQPGVFRVILQSRRTGSPAATANPLPGSALVRIF